jgi:putative ABC transport system permease protein
MVLVTGTGLLVSSLKNLLDVNLGFQREHLLSVAIDPRLSGAAKPQDPLELRRVLDQVVAVPCVQSASLAMCGLLSGCRARMDFSQIEGYQARPDEQVLFLLNAVTQDYFATVGMRLIAGRILTDRDQANPSKVAVVNETLARKYFNDGLAVGRRFGEKALDIEIVGIVEDARVLSVKDPVEPTVFFPLPQPPVLAREIQVRTQGEPQQAITMVRKAITLLRFRPTDRFRFTLNDSD